MVILPYKHFGNHYVAKLHNNHAFKTFHRLIIRRLAAEQPEVSATD